jgi:TM2 domain-containing membrane protein YozV
MIAAFLAFYFGIFGIHKLYIGQWKKGADFLVFSVTILTDFIGAAQAIQYLFMSDEEFYQRVAGHIERQGL